MNEIAFPLLGPAIVIVSVLPLSALITKALLMIVERVVHDTLPAQQGVRYAMLVASTALPLSWFMSASVHQAEDGRSALVCRALHAPNAVCVEAAYFSFALAMLAFAFAAPRLVHQQLMMRPSRTHAAHAALCRCQRVIELHAGLHALGTRLVVSDVARVPMATIGVFWPKVVVRTELVASLDDDALAAALHHEAAHLRAGDPFRYFFVAWARAVNPLGAWLLACDHARWLLGQEIRCDREAVLSGASPTALAHALVVAARPRVTAVVPTLASTRLEVLKLRLAFLSAYAERPPHPQKHVSALRVLLGLLALVLVLPHHGTTDALDAIHHASESVSSFFASI